MKAAIDQNHSLCRVLAIQCSIFCLLTSCAGGSKVTLTPTESGLFAPGPIWTLDVGDNIKSNVVTDGSHLFVRTQRDIVAFDLRTKNRVWEASLLTEQFSEFYPPVAIRSIVLAVDSNGAVSAFEARTGKQVWSACSICEAYDAVLDIATSNTMIVAARRNAPLSAYDLLTGRRLWEAGPAGTRGGQYAAIANQEIYVGLNFTLSAFDTKSGKLLWEHDFDHYLGQMVFEDPVLYISQGDFSVVAFNVNSRKILWGTPYESNNILYSWLIVTDDAIYASRGKNLVKLEKATGKTQWQFDAGSTLAKPTISENGVLLVRDLDYLYALDSVDGKVLGTLLLGNSIAQSEPSAAQGPLIIDNRVIVPIGSHWLYAYDLGS